jgi:hypothetical protein
MVLERKSMLTVLLSVVTIGLTVLFSNNLYAMFLAGIFIVGIVLVSNLKISFIVVLLTSTLNGLTNIFPNPLLRPESVAIVLSVASILYFTLLRKVKIWFPFEIHIFVLFIVQAYITSSINSPVFYMSINGINQLIFAFSGLVVISQIRYFKQGGVLVYAKWYAIIAILQSLYGLISFIMYEVFKLNIGGLMFGQGGTSVTLKGTLIEANLFGSFVGVALLLTISFMINKLVVRRWYWYVGSLILFVGLILSWTRSAWIGFIIGLLVLMMITYRNMFTQANVVKTALTAILILIPTVLLLQHQFDTASGQGGLFFSKVLNLFDSEGGTGLYRVQQYEMALLDIKGYEIFGKGYFSIKAYGDNEWISNLFLFVYHDTGIIGLTIFGCLLLNIIIKSIRTIRTPNSGQLGLILVN